MNDGRYILNTFTATISQPFCDDCRYAVQVEHHHIMLLIPWIMESIQYGVKHIIKQSLEYDFGIKSGWL